MGGAKTGEGPSRTAGLRDIGSREASVTQLSRARAARVGHQADCTERKGDLGEEQDTLGVGRGSCLAQIRDQSSRAPSWVAECKGGLLLRHLLLPGAQERNYLRELTIRRNPVPFLL